MNKKNEKFISIKKDLLAETFLVLDLETTGFSPQKGGKIIEIGGILIHKGKEVRTYHQLINPELKISKKITEITGITDKDVADKPVIGNVLPDFYEKMINNNKVVIVGQNISFDWERFLKYYFYNVGILALNHTIDTKELSKLYFSKEKGHSLGDLCQRLNIKNENAHSAMADVVATKECFLILKDMFLDKVESMPIEQSLLENELNKPVDIVKFDKSNIKINNIAYWEKEITKTKKYKRVFINCNFGQAYFDLNSKAWYIKELKSKYIDNASVNLKDLEAMVFYQLRIKSKEELIKKYV